MSSKKVKRAFSLDNLSCFISIAEYQLKAVVKSIPNTAISSIDSESSSTNHYCVVSGCSPDSRTPITDNNLKNISTPIDTSSSHFQSKTCVPIEKINLTGDIQFLVSRDNEEAEDKDNISDERIYVVHPNGDTYSECYEVTYKFDPAYPHFLTNQNEGIESNHVHYCGSKEIPQMGGKCLCFHLRIS